MLTLKPVSLTDGKAVYDMLQQIEANDNGFMNGVKNLPYEEFPAHIAKKVNMAQGIGLEDWMVPSSTFWLMDGDTPIGQGNLRHRLTNALRESGGHIGYAIDPIHRGRGCGRVLLRLLLEEARRTGITEEILVTVHPDNTASRRVAEACGGELRRETPERVYYWFN